MTTHPAWMRFFGSKSSAVWNLLAPWAPGMLALTGVLAMLLTFQQVVASGVENSQARHRADAEQADALWRCNAGRVTLQRSGCPAPAGGLAPSNTLP